MKVSARLTFDKLVFNKDSDLHLVVSLTAPKLDWQARRPPIMVVPVIDISGSMQGAKLDYAKQSVIKLLDHLQPGDFAGVITFESSVELVAAPTEITQTRKDELKAKVSRLQTRGSTAFADGMLLALQQVNKADLPENILVRVIMFTDGQANVGPRGREILNLIDQNIGRASISAFGYGQDADQELLADLSNKAKGNYAFIKNPDDAPAAFAKELGGLLSMYAQNIVINVTPQGDHKLTQVVSEVTSVVDGSSTSLKVPELLSEEVRNLVLQMKALSISQTTILSSPITYPFVNVKVSYETIDQAGVRSSHMEELPINVTFVAPGDEQTKATTDVDVVVALAQMVRAQVEAEKLAASGQYDAAFVSMNAVSSDLDARGHTTIGNITAKIGTRLKSAQAFAASASYRSSTKSGGSRAYGLSGSDSEALQDISDMGITFSNIAQNSIVESFTAPVTPPAPDDSGISNPDTIDSTVTPNSK